MPDVPVGLADAIRELRRELAEAMAEGQGQQVRFELGPVEIEFLLEITKAAEGDAGVRFWVVSLGGKGSFSSGSTHRVQLSLTPRDHSPGSPPKPLEVSDKERAARPREETRADSAPDAGIADDLAGQRSAGVDAP
jgi:Trypsin-co-occurring domain 2